MGIYGFKSVATVGLQGWIIFTFYKIT